MNVPFGLQIPAVVPVILGVVILTDGVLSFVPIVIVPVDILSIPASFVEVIVPPFIYTNPSLLAMALLLLAVIVGFPVIFTAGESSVFAVPKLSIPALFAVIVPPVIVNFIVSSF